LQIDPVVCNKDVDQVLVNKGLPFDKQKPYFGDAALKLVAV
jgi:hypothetical protein